MDPEKNIFEKIFGHVKKKAIHLWR